jgi:hypothetical protein
MQYSQVVSNQIHLAFLFFSYWLRWGLTVLPGLASDCRPNWDYRCEPLSQPTSPFFNQMLSECLQ